MGKVCEVPAIRSEGQWRCANWSRPKKVRIKSSPIRLRYAISPDIGARPSGGLFESYAMGVLAAAISKVSGPKDVFVDGQNGYNGADLILLQNNTATIIEITSSGVPINKQLSGDWSRIEKSIDWILFKTQDGSKGKMQQIIDAVNKLKSGKLAGGGKAGDEIKDIFQLSYLKKGFPRCVRLFQLSVKKQKRQGWMQSRRLD